MHPLTVFLIFMLFGPTLIVLYLARKFAPTMRVCIFFVIWSLPIFLIVHDIMYDYGSENPDLTALFIELSYLIVSCSACYFLINTRK